MKITGVRTARLPGGRCVATIDTDAALSGLGFGTDDSVATLPGIVAAFLAGQDPRAVAGLWQRMMDGVAGRGAAARDAVAVLDLALWDLKAKANHEPLWRALGGLRPRVNVHAAPAKPGADDAAVERAYASLARECGVRGAMLPAGGDVDTDLRRLERASATLAAVEGPPVLMLDFGERLHPKDAARRVRLLEELHDLTLVRDPARRHDAAGLARVSAAIRAAVCTGGRLRAPDEYLAHLKAHAPDVVEVGVDTAGITGALQVADTAFGFELPVILAESPGHLNAHLAAAIPTCMSMAVHTGDASGLLASDVRIEDGWAVVGDAPGHGIVVDPSIFTGPATDGRRASRGRA